MSTLQELRHQSVRDVTGTARDYSSDWMQLFIDAGFTVGTFNERMLLWINDYLGTSYVSLPQAMQAFAVDQGFTNWSSMGTFVASGDTTAPTVSTFSPADNATDVAITATLTATFDETVVLGAAGVITLKKTSDNSTIDSWDVALDSGSGAGQVEVLTNTALTLHLSASLANSIEYYVVWDAGVVKDAADNNVAALSVTTTWSFTTVAEEGYEFVNAEAEAVANAFSTPPTAERAEQIDDFVGLLKSHSLWAKLDVLHVYAAADAQAALINWKNPGTFNASLVNSPTHTADEGFAGNGTTSYVSSGFNPSTAGGSYTQDSAAMGGYVRTARASGAAYNLYGGYAAVQTNGTDLLPRFTDDKVYFTINGPGGNIANTTVAGMWISRRTASNATAVFRNAVSIQTGAIASVALNNAVLYVGARNAAGTPDRFSTDQVAVYFASGALDNTEIANITSDINAYMTALGKNVL